jgi:thiol-disulfide isomerase/thioredoxin
MVKSAMVSVVAFIAILGLGWSPASSASSGGEPSTPPVVAGVDSSGNLLGPVTREQLYSAFPGWKDRSEVYVPQGEIIGKLKELNARIDAVVFLGTWCKDSRSEVPKFLKVYDRAANVNFTLTMYGVDRSKKDGQGLTEKYGVTRVPTFIFMKDGKELGRIVEFPRSTMEGDFLSIAAGK